MNESPTWWQAVTTVPRLKPGQWQTLALPVRWLLAVRSSVLFMTLMSAALGGLLAWRDGRGDLGLWLLCVLGLMLAHATNNLLNDLTDSAKGIDAGNYYRNQYGVHVLEDGLLSRKQFLVYIGFTGGAALLVGVYLIAERGGLTLPLMLGGAFFVLFYTWPLKYIGLGEPAVLLVWGPLMVGGSYYVSTGEWSTSAAWLGLLYGIGPTTVLFGKHIDKLEMDRDKGVRTLPVLLGQRNARYATQGLLVSQYIGCAVLIANGTEHWILAVVLLSVPALLRALKALQHTKPLERPESYPKQIWPLWFSAHAFGHTRQFTSLFIAALLVAVWL
ncbi:prenyltransferase [Congregibacter brevis]|uniref:Prenyltransferase n=1 Tax=Congregibacter brevis TaxID=3081201 RepID=A0ABZ0I8Z4_9GAMM|nr:prenyltransferase [Congregibacter sp. IMCC45268]